MGRQGYVGLGHGEDATRLDDRLIRLLPAGELVANLLGLLAGDGHHIAGCVERPGIRAPGTTVQIVGHDVVGHVLRVEVHVLSDSVGERDIASGQVAISAPCNQAVRAAAGGRRLRQAAHTAGDAHRPALAHRFAALVLVGRRACVPQVEPGRGQPLGLDHDLAVHMVAVIVVRDFVRNERYALNVVCGDVAAINSYLVGVENVVPGIGSLGNDAAGHARGPLYDTVRLGGDVAVLLVVGPYRSCNVNLSESQASSP